MKIRTDFVSNSSSSSFIVKAEKDTPNIFKETDPFNFSEYANNFLFRDMFECYDNVCWGWTDWPAVDKNKPLNGKIKIIPDDMFANMYMTRGIPDFILPKCCEKYINDIYTIIEEILNIEAERTPVFFENGQQSPGMRSDWLKNRLDRKYKVKDKLDKIFKKIGRKIAGILRPLMKNWKFYYVELEDHDEETGFSAVEDVKWYRIFNNH